MTATKAKTRKGKAGKRASKGGLLASDQGELPGSKDLELAIDLIDLFPAYTSPPDLEEVDRRKVSLSGPEGQLQAIEVRPKEGGRFELIAGRHNWLAAGELGWKTIKARVRALSDAQAWRLWIASDFERRVISPIEEAQRAESLCRSVEEGGAGFTRQQAASMLRLESHSAVSNLVSLLRLPPEWQERVAAGDLPESWARCLVKIAEAPRLLAHCEKAWKDGAGERRKAGRRCPWSSRVEVETLVGRLLWRETRPMDGKTKFEYSYSQIGSVTGSFPRLFELDDKLVARLDVVKLDRDGEELELATHVELFDELNIPLVQAKLEKKAERAQEVEESAAELLENVREEVKEEWLQKRILLWRAGWLGELVARELAAVTAGPPKGALRGVVKEHRRRMEAALHFLTWLAAGGLVGYTDTAADGAEKLRGAIGAPAPELYVDPWKVLTWGRKKGLVDWPAIGSFLAAVVSTPPTKSGIVVIPIEVLEGLAGILELDLAGEWVHSQKNGGGHLLAFATLHQGDQLDRLGEELEIHLAEGSSRAAKLLLFDRGTGPRAVPLPKSLSGETSKRRKKKGGR